jgi:hypothetical protein
MIAVKVISIFVLILAASAQDNWKGFERAVGVRIDGKRSLNEVEVQNK